MEKGPRKNIVEFSQNIPETGVTADFFNEFTLVELSTKSDLAWNSFWNKEYVQKRIEENGNKVVRRYEERYPADIFDYNKLSPETKKRIEKLNEITEKINEAYASGKFNRKMYERLLVEAIGLIYGEGGRIHTHRREIFENEFGEKLED
jgi:hypothetical protein